MPLIVDEQAVQAQSRIAGLRVCLFTLRFTENWRQDVDDFESAMILIAVTAIMGEHLTRTSGLPQELKDLRHVYPPERLPRCNVSSLAAATGFNRETTRRKVNELIKMGLLARATDGAISLAPGLVQEASTFELIRKQIDAIVRLVNELLRDGILKAV